MIADLLSFFATTGMRDRDLWVVTASAVVFIVEPLRNVLLENYSTASEEEQHKRFLIVRRAYSRGADWHMFIGTQCLLKCGFYMHHGAKTEPKWIFVHIICISVCRLVQNFIHYRSAQKPIFNDIYLPTCRMYLCGGKIGIYVGVIWVINGHFVVFIKNAWFSSIFCDNVLK